MSTQVQSAAKTVLANAVAIGDAILHTGSIVANVQSMAKMLREARRIEKSAPARAAQLRQAANRMVLA